MLILNFLICTVQKSREYTAGFWRPNELKESLPQPEGNLWGWDYLPVTPFPSCSLNNTSTIHPVPQAKVFHTPDVASTSAPPKPVIPTCGLTAPMGSQVSAQCSYPTMLLSKPGIQGSLPLHFPHSDPWLSKMLLILSEKLGGCTEKRRSIDTKNMWVKKKKRTESDMVVCAFKRGTWEPGGALWDPDQPGLCTEFYPNQGDIVRPFPKKENKTRTKPMV